MLFCFFQNASAQSIVLIDEKKSDDYDLKGAQIAVLEDSSNTFQIEKILTKDFTPHTGDNYFPFIKNANYTYWLRIKLQSKTRLFHHYVLENSDSHIDSLELYKQNLFDTTWKSENAGFLIPFQNRKYNHKNFVFDINIDTTVQTFYIKIKSTKNNPFIIKIRSTSAFSEYALSEYVLLGIFYGIIILVIVYNLLIFISLKDRVYLYYVFYVVVCAFISLLEDGLGFQYLWSNLPVINIYINSVLPLLFLVSFVLYARSFLELKTFFPTIYKILTFILLFYTLLFLVSRLIFGYELSFNFYMIPFMYICYATYLSFTKGLRQSRYFIIGLISIAFLILRMSGLLQLSHYLFVYSFNFGLVFEIVILSVALSDRIRIIREKHIESQNRMIEQLKENEQLKDILNNELEEKVRQRTKMLDEKNLELEEAYEEINSINELLDADNKVLKTNVKELTKARVLMKDVNFEEFSGIFPDKESCLTYLANLKWAKGYECKKCGNTKWCDGKEEHYKRCTKCRYDESPTAYTIFHKLKFPINKAFYVLFLVYANKEKITSLELSHILSLRQSTCWTFNKKVLDLLSKKKKNYDNEIDGWGNLILHSEEE